MKALQGLALTVFLLGLTSCAAGPHQLRQTLNYDQHANAQNSWLSGIQWIIPILPLARLGGAVADFFRDDEPAWDTHAWDGQGTAYWHHQGEPPGGALDSLLCDDAQFFQ